ncbi:pyrimidine/purine nucleoside phosphorylase [Gaoshiqia sp. Z1-71]|uniref:pyrimidine/purine nucleoside phosphorylase n=1 Tax=Gaoshiqia hydrogeniformans TaxID=3290090 RepID=UPI003BF80142
MLKVNEYFGGTVKSIALENAEGVATVGVMESGEYEFGTSTIELMTVTSGLLDVLLPGETDWKTFGKGETFRLEKDVRFKVKANGQVAYYCLYL